MSKFGSEETLHRIKIYNEEVDRLYPKLEESESFLKLIELIIENNDIECINSLVRMLEHTAKNFDNVDPSFLNSLKNIKRESIRAIAISDQKDD